MFTSPANRAHILSGARQAQDYLVSTSSKRLGRFVCGHKQNQAELDSRSSERADQCVHAAAIRLCWSSSSSFPRKARFVRLSQTGRMLFS